MNDQITDAAAPEQDVAEILREGGHTVVEGAEAVRELIDHVGRDEEVVAFVQEDEAVGGDPL